MDTLVLVLNLNYEPINVCNTHRAIILMLAGKAALIANGTGVIQTVSNSYPLPSVIRLAHMVQRPRQRVKLTRHELFRRDNYTCQYCGKRIPNPTIDHVIPRRLGGQHIWTNVVTACSACNHAKGGKLLEESRNKLLSTPHEPPANLNYLFGKHIQANADWAPFIKGW